MPNFVSESFALRRSIIGNGQFQPFIPGLAPQGAGKIPSVAFAELDALGVVLRDDLDPSGHPFPAGDNTSIPAGYTYLGQFIDHDLSLEPTALPTDRIDTSRLVNFRTSCFDLDSLLGFGPTVSPLLYERTGKLRTPSGGVAQDLPRLPDQTPLIGDARNDENLFVGQLHTAFINFYNKVFDDLGSSLIVDLGPTGGTLAERAARIVRWHYQWIVLNDFLPRIVDPTILYNVLTAGPTFYHPDPVNPKVPLEFSGAAYRFGHSMVRERYHVNVNFPDATLMDLFVFSSSGGSLPVPSSWVVNWNRLFEIDPATVVNSSRRIDPYLAPQLHNLPGVPSPSSLASRNLVRGWMWGLPSGQTLATAMGITPLTSSQILADASGQLFKESTQVSSAGFDVDTPLWYYILKEASVTANGVRLGPLGSKIVAEVFIGLLRADSESYLSINPSWTPTLPSSTANQFTMSDLFRYLPPSAINPNGSDQGGL